MDEGRHRKALKYTERRGYVKSSKAGGSGIVKSKNTEAVEEATRARGRGTCGARGLEESNSIGRERGARLDDERDHCKSSRRHNDSDKEEWLHDKYDLDGDEPPPINRIRPSGYRPPKPKWVSRAGGVAIMRNYAAESEDEYDLT